MNISMQPVVITLSSVLATACVIGEDATFTDYLDDGAGSIVNATNADDRAHTQVGMITMSSGSLCSSTLIAPRVAVTAAHCLEGATVTSFESEDFRTNVVAQVAHPDHSGGVNDDDIGLVLLASPAPFAPASIDRAQVAIGTRALAVGYGYTGPNNGDPGTRRSGTLKVDEVGRVYGDMMSALPDPSTICYGDSGGALLDGGRLVGVTSGTAVFDGGCKSWAFFVRIDRHYDFLANQVAAWGETLAAPAPACGLFAIDEQLLPGQVKPSCNRRYQLIHQTDGNVVLYELADGLVPRWATSTDGQATSTLVMQGDGNLVVYGPAGAAYNTQTGGNPGTVGYVQDDGNFVLYAPDGRALWANGTTR